MEVSRFIEYLGFSGKEEALECLEDPSPIVKKYIKDLKNLIDDVRIAMPEVFIVEPTRDDMVSRICQIHSCIVMNIMQFCTQESLDITVFLFLVICRLGILEQVAEAFVLNLDPSLVVKHLKSDTWHFDLGKLIRDSEEHQLAIKGAYMSIAIFYSGVIKSILH